MFHSSTSVELAEVATIIYAMVKIIPLVKEIAYRIIHCMDSSRVMNRYMTRLTATRHNQNLEILFLKGLTRT